MPKPPRPRSAMPRKAAKFSGESTAKGVGDWFHRKYVQGKNREGGIINHFFEWFWNANYQIEDARFEFSGDGVYLLFGSKHKDLSLARTVRRRPRQSENSPITTKKTQRENNLPMQSETSVAHHIAAHLERIGEISVANFLDAAVARRLAWRRNEIAKKRREKSSASNIPKTTLTRSPKPAARFSTNHTRELPVSRVEPEAGHSYLVICDPSIGIEGSGDPAAIGVIDRLTGEQVHSWRGYEKQDGQGKRCCDLSDKYFGADIVVESNMGEGVIIEIENRGFGHRLYKYIDVQTQRDIDMGKISMIGGDGDAHVRVLPMTDKTKRTAITLFEKAWREGDFQTCSQNLCDEAVVFVQDGNKMGAKSGYHDDEIMMCAIGWFVIETDYIGKASFKSSGVKHGSSQMKGF